MTAHFEQKLVGLDIDELLTLERMLSRHCGHLENEMDYGLLSRVERTPPILRSALYSLFSPAFRFKSVTRFDLIPLGASPPQKPARGFPAQASSCKRSPMQNDVHFGLLAVFDTGGEIFRN